MRPSHPVRHLTSLRKAVRDSTLRRSAPLLRDRDGLDAESLQPALHPGLAITPIGDDRSRVPIRTKRQRGRAGDLGRGGRPPGWPVRDVPAEQGAGLGHRWMAVIPTPLNPADHEAGYWWGLSMRQIEVSRTMVFDDPRRARGFFESLVADNLGIGRPEQVVVLFARQVRKTTKEPFRTRVFSPGTEVKMGFAYKHSRVKQYPLCIHVHAVAGFTNESLRCLVAGLLGTDYTSPQMTYDLAVPPPLRPHRSARGNQHLRYKPRRPSRRAF